MSESIRITRKNAVREWVAKHPDAESKSALERWLRHLQRKGFNAYSLYRFCEWTHKSPAELLRLKKENPDANIVEKLLDDYVGLPDDEVCNSAKYHTSIAVKSFFRWNYRDLAKASGKVELVKVKAYNKLTKEGLRKLWSYACNMRERALVPFVLSTGVAKGTLPLLQWNDFEENWENQEIPCLNIPPEKIKGHGIGRYKGVRQITFLTPEAKAALIEYRNWIERRLNVKLKPSDNIWLDVRGSYKSLEYDSFSTVISRLSRESGVAFSWHDARRWVETAIEQIAISPNWAKKIRGRKVKGEEAPYSQPNIEQLRAKYKEAVTILEFTTDRQAEIDKEKLKQELKEELGPEMLERLRKAGIDMRREPRTPTAKDLGEREEPEPENENEECEDGEHCPEFKQVKEEELLTYLQAGWSIVKELKSGDCIVQRGE